MLLKLMIVCFLLTACLCEGSKSPDSEDASVDDKDSKDAEVSHENHPRGFGFFHRPTYHYVKHPMGGHSAVGHVGNGFHGGSIGFGVEFRPFAPVRTIIDHAVKFIPGHHRPPQKPKHPHGSGYYPPPHRPKPHDDYPDDEPFPNKEPPKKPDTDFDYPDDEPFPKPPKKPNADSDYPDDEPFPKPPKKPNADSDYPDDEPFPKPPQKPNAGIGKPKPNKERPQKPKTEIKEPDEDDSDLPSWEDIGENPHKSVPIEEIIQPRKRPKRFIESKVYHVPLQFRSNAKPYKVKIKRENRKVNE